MKRLLLALALLALSAPAWAAPNTTQPPGNMLNLGSGGTPASAVCRDATGALLYEAGVDCFPATVTSVPVRQTVLGGPVDTNGLPTFLPSTATGLAITSQNVTSSAPLIAAAANGFGSSGAVDAVGQSTTNLTWSGLTNSTTNYLYVTVSGGALVTGSTTVQPVYQFGGAYSTAAGAFVFDIQQMLGKLGNGSSAAQANIVFVGEVVTSGGNVTSTVTYAIMERYIGAWTATLPGTGTLISANDNIGYATKDVVFEIENLTAEQGYSVGDVVSAVSGSNSGYTSVFNPTTERNSTSVTTTANSPFTINNKSSGASVNLTAADWAYRFRSKRGW